MTWKEKKKKTANLKAILIATRIFIAIKLKSDSVNRSSIVHVCASNWKSFTLFYLTSIKRFINCPNSFFSAFLIVRDIGKRNTKQENQLTINACKFLVKDDMIDTYFKMSTSFQRNMILPIHFSYSIVL